MQRKKPNKAESEYMRRVQEIGCIVCREKGIFTPALVHHCDTGMGRKRDHYKTIPMCFMHHSYSSPLGFHSMGKEVWEKRFGTQKYFMNKVSEILKDE